jgi:hypothetical protein
MLLFTGRLSALGVVHNLSVDAACIWKPAPRLNNQAITPFPATMAGRTFHEDTKKS